MLMRTDPFLDLDRLAQQVFGTVARPATMPIDAWREGEHFLAELDLPGVDPDSLDLDIERNVLTVKAERPELDSDKSMIAAERPRGTFRRQLFLGEGLDAERIRADYANGVLRLVIPLRESAKPRKIEIEHRNGERQAISA
ncbi:Hsp20 family protein [Nocardia brasiliensis]|uniref:Hsp20 family protein n=1 Tax=Nocardia brasiliensis TaxID=37326 RepID=A0A6G9Y2F7_NOCBR|nr:HSP20 family small heat-shock protein [Nocardia brasiliensis]QIS07310.1 Hsp20 family protein [Nocardia brasiliensis]